jgi:hypothetical protein
MLGNNLFIEPAQAIITDLTGKETVQNNGFQSDKAFDYPGFQQMTEIVNANINGFYQPQNPVFSNDKQLDFKLSDIPELDDDPLIAAVSSPFLGQSKIRYFSFS